MDRFQFKKFMGPVSKTRQFELFIFIKCVIIKLAKTNYIAKKVTQKILIFEKDEQSM